MALDAALWQSFESKELACLQSTAAEHPEHWARIILFSPQGLCTLCTPTPETALPWEPTGLTPFVPQAWLTNHLHETFLHLKLQRPLQQRHTLSFPCPDLFPPSHALLYTTSFVDKFIVSLPLTKMKGPPGPVLLSGFVTAVFQPLERH